jgi:hypothetical protein
MEGKSTFNADMEKILADNLAEVVLCLERFSLVKLSKERQTFWLHHRLIGRAYPYTQSRVSVIAIRVSGRELSNLSV